MDDPNITMEEYIRLEEEKAQKRGKVFNWETAKYGKIWYDKDILDLRSVETKFRMKYLLVNPRICMCRLAFRSTLNGIIRMVIVQECCGGQDMALPPRDQRHQYLKFEGLQYTEGDIANFETRLARIYKREGCSGIEFEEAVLNLDIVGALRFQLEEARRCLSGRQFILALGLYTAEEMETVGFDFLGTAPSYTSIRDLILRLCHRRFAAGRKSGALILGGQFVARLAEHFGLLTEERLQGVAVEAPVAPRGGDEDEEMPQTVPRPPRTQGERISRLEEEVHGMREALQGQREVLDSMSRDFSRFTTWTVTSLARLMDRAGVPYTRYSESSIEYERRTRRMTDGASTSTAPQ
ncbi:hypothetical protein Tco_0271693 [Tanacetum coccineum]